MSCRREMLKSDVARRRFRRPRVGARGHVPLVLLFINHASLTRACFMDGLLSLQSRQGNDRSSFAPC